MNRRLPDSEFEIMDIIWTLGRPVISSDIIDHISKPNCKAPTIISYLKRLEEKKFVSSEKKGKERVYQALVSRDEYLSFETKLFFGQYHHNSILSFMNALAQSKALKTSDIEKLRKELDKYEKQ